MKHFLMVLLCLLLCSCSPRQNTPPVETAPETQAAAEAAGLYDPDHPMEQTYPGAVRAYPLSLRKVRGLRVLGSNVLILSGHGSTTLTLLTGETLWAEASLTVDFELQQDDPSLQIHEKGISFFDPQRQETLILDHRLQEVRRITAPQGLSGKPILSSDTGTLYYCTAWSVMAWDLESGIRRTVKEVSYSTQMLTALHQEDLVLECTVTDGGKTDILLLSSDNGSELNRLSGNVQLKTGDSGFFAVLPNGFQNLMIFENSNASTELLLPELHPQQQFYLEKDHAVVTVNSDEDGIYLDYYELNTGILRASLTLDKLQMPTSIVNSQDHAIYILVYDPAADCDILYRWDVLRQAPDPSNTQVYTTPYRSQESPDLEALEHCRELSRNIGEKYGITVRIWEDACTHQPWDYQFSPEYLAPVLEQELKLLDQRLARYPEEILKQTISHFTGLTICLVREITGTSESSSPNSATGIQFFEEEEAYVVITTGQYSEQALYHELYHVMDTHILTESTALDQWEALNPVGFSYSKGAYGPEDFDIYLQGQTRAFADRYSMTYPKEDRARILENAMLQGKKDLFLSEYMQQKLSSLCRGIREAYKLDKLPEVLPWEQYLVTPLAPSA